MHADDERQDHREDCRHLLQELRDGTTSLCVDEGFDLDESKNRSLIGGEYFERLTATHTATAVIAYLFASERVQFVPRKTPAAVKKCIEQCVRKKRDRTFLVVAHNSDEQVLGSYDYEDMSAKKRRHLEVKTGVRIVDAPQVRAMMRKT
jgi:hypothetical protein